MDVSDLAELGKGVFEGSPDCVKLLDAEGNIIAMNRNGLCAMEIDDFRTIRGANWATLWTQENRHAIEAAIARKWVTESERKDAPSQAVSAAAAKVPRPPVFVPLALPAAAVDGDSGFSYSARAPG